MVTAAPVEAAYGAIVDAGTDIVVAVPDSLLSPLLDRVGRSNDVRYVQVNDEATAVGVAAGAVLAGCRALVLMENSGLRRACETLSRLVLAHRLHVALLISHRGSFGEENWWGIAHSPTMTAHLEMLRMPRRSVGSIAQLGPALTDAFAMLGTGQCSPCVVAERPLLHELRYGLGATR